MNTTDEWHMTASTEEKMNRAWNEIVLMVGPDAIMLDQAHRESFNAGWCAAQISNEKAMLAQLKAMGFEDSQD